MNNLIIVLDNKVQKDILNYIYLFVNHDIKIIKPEDLIKTHDENKSKNYLFINSNLAPKKTIIEKLIKIINNDTINFCYLSKCHSIYFVKGDNIVINKHIIDIKKSKLIIELFDDINLLNQYEHIMIPNDLNIEYIRLLKLKEKNYDNMINTNISYKSYEKLLKTDIKDIFCYNFVLFITKIEDLNKITFPDYFYYRITLFHNIKNIEDINILHSFCKKNNIIAYFYLSNKWTWFFNINNKRLLWFEKVVLLNDFNKLNLKSINNLNKYHSVKNNILNEHIISISASDFVLIPFLGFQKNYSLGPHKIFNLIKSYIYTNCKSDTYIKLNHIHNINIVYKLKPTFIQNNLLLIKNYPKIVDSVNEEIKNNYDQSKLLALLAKKVSLSVLFKPEEEFIIDAGKIINSINDLQFLSNLTLLFSNIKNQQITNKLYVKILKLSSESKFSKITLLCFQKLITSINIDEETIIALFDFINLVTKNKLIDINILKKTMVALFLSVGKYISNEKIINQFNAIINDIFNLDDLMNIDKLLLISNDFKENNICVLHFLVYLTTNFSAYYNNFNQFINKRKEITKNLEYLLGKEIPLCSIEQITLIPVSNFFLSYQGIPSVDIFRLKSKLIRKICTALNYSIDTNFINKKINICFHSNFLNRWHSVFKDRHQVIKGLSLDDRFNVYFSTFEDLNEDVKYLFGNAKHIKLLGNLNEIKNKLEELKLDVLVYCEIGMDPKAYFMAHMKLAKIQINTWGHSDTSGIDTIDYFFSSKLYELPYEQSKKHYSEKLILQNSLCTSYINPIKRYNIELFKNRYEFGFTDEVIVYFCAQSLFKFNPLFDEYIINILQSVDNAILVILNSDSKAEVIKRFNNKNITNKIHVFPGMQHNLYLNLMNISDVILDPYPFGGCNSSFEALSMNKVIVSQSGNMINGRFTTGFYLKMGLDELICKTRDEYVNLAIKFGTNKEYRHEYENKIKEKHSCLFNDEETIQEWKDDIIKIVKDI
jgi:hypothetical protein